MNKEINAFLFEILSDHQIKVDDIIHKYPDEELQTFKNGEVIVNQGDKAEDLYIILQGRSIVYNTIDWSLNNIVDYLERPHIIGLIETLTNYPTYTSYVVALSDCICFHIKTSDFINIIKKDASLCYETLLIMGMTTDNNMTHAEINTVFPAKDILGYYFYQKSKNNLPYTCPIPRTQLAEELHINLRTLYRYLNYFKKRKYISISKAQIIIDKKEFKNLSDRYADVLL